MAARKGFKSAEFVGNSLDEDRGETEYFEFADFEPFMASFNQYRLELSDTEKKAFMFKGLCNTRDNPHIVNIKNVSYDL